MLMSGDIKHFFLLYCVRRLTGWHKVNFSHRSRSATTADNTTPINQELLWCVCVDQTIHY